MDVGARFVRMSVHGASVFPGNLAAASARAISAMLLMSSLALVARRLAGALVQPLNAGLLLAATAVVVLAAAGARFLWLRSGVRVTSTSIVARQAALSAAVLLFALTVSLPGSSAAALMIAWIMALGGEAVGWTASWRRRSVRSGSTPSTQTPPRLHAIAGECVEQQLIYTRAPTGDVLVRGAITASFAARQRTATAHVAFCPPLTATPAIEFNQTAGPSTRTRLGLVLPWGVRFDMKLDEAPSAACEVRLEFRAQTSASGPLLGGPSLGGPPASATGTAGDPPPSRAVDGGR